MFSRTKKSNIDMDDRPGDVFAAMKNDIRREEAKAANAPPPPEPKAPQRPGDIPVRNFIATTVDSLNKLHASYSNELEALDKDIAKLREERRQLVVVLHGVTSALAEMKKADEDPTATKPAKMPNVANYAINEGVNSAGKPANGQPS